VFGLDPQEINNTPAAGLFKSSYATNADEVVRAKILAYAVSTWQSYASKFKEFKRFCDKSEILITDCCPPTVISFVLKMAAEGKSVGSINGYITAIEFTFRWFLLTDLKSDPHMADIKKFVEKTCPKTTNKKQALSVAEIRKIWDKLLHEFGALENIPLLKLRTFTMTVIQHASFCRFSDISHLKLDDVVYNFDHYTVNIRYSKTDQEGRGQVAYIPKNENQLRCPHMLMSLFIHKIHNDPDPDVYLFPPLK
jgi:site-specific recombinase XerD